ncbi:HlyD family type I secretion periplasmic adaptor subunit [Bradyrhizobium ottawaense]|uniref:Membrane fusion protein (MFP) family protein n=1 Tax=Bradyrhizobium ottawaense TaxID=931866 RepID=A0ABV4G832_9BRAD|nr:HlyD family type I secretion periplasmic adaptor subunit [Bradyrhizobium ottawaense]MBR1294952.1 HlyD family type I secretion periplasmic adaptor subunit [Bradyrhizobium ottawaense]WLB44260.1 HlyD family type I secretion periplasmic adaptor subunit [Bradyrhizobium ottawaense]WQN81561.1 HlyD family type I secretion periplasmic adaptor subunit [Bradyrhizobium ottawaense]BBO03850.1 HlyD family type I secretion periplasmic adaptor subunit [Bradyrhizobium ottawaense]GMO41713.1 HlyD family type I
MRAVKDDIGEWYRGVPLSAKWPIFTGLAILVVWLGCFGIWAAVAPLNSAVVASGTFVATGQNKLVQHFEGGIIREIAVKDGDVVEANQVLVRMDDTAATAKLKRLVLKKYRLLAMKARLEAEMNSSDAIETPAEFRENARDPEIKAILERQRAELQARRASLVTDESVLVKQIAGLEESIRGYQAQVQSTKERISLFAEELKDKNSLLGQQLVRKSDVLALRRSEAGLGGELGEYLGRIADSKERIAQANERIAQLHTTALREAIKELRETEAELDDGEEQIRAAQDVVDRVNVRSPVRGIVVKNNFHTPGGVVSPGAVILELLPIGDERIIEAHVNPKDISHVSVGQEALVRLSALNQRITPMVGAIVIYVSADALAEQVQGKAETRPDGDTRREFYVVRVRLDQDDILRRMPEFIPTPGMPADVYIKTGERTFFEYIMKPVLDSFSRAFRET